MEVWESEKYKCWEEISNIRFNNTNEKYQIGKETNDKNVSWGCMVGLWCQVWVVGKIRIYLSIKYHLFSVIYSLVNLHLSYIIYVSIIYQATII